MKIKFIAIFFITTVFTLNLLSCQSNTPRTEVQQNINPLNMKTGLKEKEEVTEVPIEPAAYVNQHGYLIGAEKYFISNIYGKVFTIIDSTSKETIFNGKMELNIEDDRSSGMTTYIGYFTELDTSGNYNIVLEDSTESFPFSISVDMYNEVAKKSILSYYFQRCGTPLLPENAGEFSREVCHTNDSTFHQETGKNGKKDTTGGWHDAGDYGKYVTPAAITLGPMLIAYEQWPEKYRYDDNGIPESGNGISDFLDEVKYELDWIIKMQNKDESSELYGAVHYMVNTLDYIWSTPDEDESERLLYGYSSVATADFAAILAQAYRTYKNIPQYSKDAEKYLEAALIAWDFLEKNPELYPQSGYKRPPDTSTGGYVESADGHDSDDRNWAAVELYLSTKDEKFHTYALKEKTIRNSGSFSRIPDWADATAMAQWQYMLADSNLVDTEAQNKLKEAFIRNAESLVKGSKKDGFRDVLSRYYWGSNGGIMLKAHYLITAYEFTGNMEFYNTALAQLNYMLGLNPVNISYITKFGSVYPKQIHHAAILNDDSDDIYPGMVPGGANGNINSDDVLSAFFERSTPDALCYIDHFNSWGSNENCILYNGPLVGVAAYFSTIK